MIIVGDQVIGGTSGGGGSSGGTLGDGSVTRAKLATDLLNQVPPALSDYTTGLTVDLDAESGITLASGAVASWASTVGSYTAAQSTAGQRPTVGVWGNGRACVSFDGVDDRLVIPWAAGLDLAALTVFVVCRLVRSSSDGLTTAAIVIGRPYSDPIGTPYYEWSLYIASASALEARADGAALSGALTNNHTFDEPWIISLSIGAAGSSATHNGRRVASGGTTSVGYSSSLGIGIGGQATTAGGEYARCDVARVRIYSTQLTADQRRTVTRYLGQRYDVAVVESLTI